MLDYEGRHCCCRAKEERGLMQQNVCNSSVVSDDMCDVAALLFSGVKCVWF